MLDDGRDPREVACRPSVSAGTDARVRRGLLREQGRLQASTERAVILRIGEIEDGLAPVAVRGEAGLELAQVEDLGVEVEMRDVGRRTFEDR